MNAKIMYLILELMFSPALNKDNMHKCMHRDSAAIEYYYERLKNSNDGPKMK